MNSDCGRLDFSSPASYKGPASHSQCEKWSHHEFPICVYLFTEVIHVSAERSSTQSGDGDKIKANIYYKVLKDTNIGVWNIKNRVEKNKHKYMEIRSQKVVYAKY